MVLEDVARPPHQAPRRRAPTGPRRGRNFWQRHYAFTAAVVAGTLALVVALVSTCVYAQVDAGRTITTEPTTVPPPPRPGAPSERGPDVRRAPEVLPESDLAKKAAASVRMVKTQDESGQPVEGSAFVVGSFGGQTLLLTSFAVVRAATRAPAPTITVEGSGQVTLWTWQEDKDLALLVVPGGIETLPWASGARVGEKIWAAGAGQKLAVGVVTATAAGIEHNIFTEGVRQGAPLVNQKGEVVAMASAVYNPTGKATDTVFYGVPIRAACEKVLRCGGGTTSPTSGGSGAGATTTTPPTTSP